jgi:hypothetical protein
MKRRDRLNKIASLIDQYKAEADNELDELSEAIIKGWIGWEKDLFAMTKDEVHLILRAASVYALETRNKQHLERLDKFET